MRRPGWPHLVHRAGWDARGDRSCGGYERRHLEGRTSSCGPSYQRVGEQVPAHAHLDYPRDPLGTSTRHLADKNCPVVLGHDDFSLRLLRSHNVLRFCGDGERSDRRPQQAHVMPPSETTSQQALNKTFIGVPAQLEAIK
jgi:hypothetical protein